ncbi:MAG: DUF805 domain-containing protein [Prevotella sp.]|nr:DUF805 domain-containing protein [Prevotella sp.]
MENFKQIPTLGFSEACKLASSRIADFKGRSRRSELWWWMLVVMVANMVIGMFFTANLLLSAIVAIIVMFFGLAVTVRRVQDTGKSAMWVYASYGLGIVNQLLTAFSPAMQEVMDLAQSGDLEAITGALENNMGDLAMMSTVGTLWSIVSLVVIVFCLLDSTPGPNKYGDSPKYVSAA